MKEIIYQMHCQQCGTTKDSVEKTGYCQVCKNDLLVVSKFTQEKLNVRKIESELKRVLRGHGILPGKCRLRFVGDNVHDSCFEYNHFDVLFNCEASRRKKQKKTKITA